VNAALAAKLMAEDADAAGKKKQQPATELLADERFKRLFEDKAFAIDEKSEEYKALHPNAGQSELALADHHCAQCIQLLSCHGRALLHAEMWHHIGRSINGDIYAAAEANLRQKQLLREHFEELEDASEEDEEGEEAADATTSAEEESDEDQHKKVTHLLAMCGRVCST
jgi:hypothetical protein